ncbi:MAG: tRNA (adenosine(37)-N6)-threonylcarbamoyltransferase complex dimerization subunit type 1 TsaB [Proteobacteria bacterium]|nr:tRNA (adenosine(37)-N6)-threonylcarbamoyltransferase complex dimerization subunit type 1 TsaB [Desulfobacterales bacterium]MBL7172693.1 tRNA (adenosine(37)-N6)-threonylcarbamoyltransferase complex dimerization subunit type 1 TsaB [Desulfobacteraceae bacterium]MBU0734129.1 tRNA (adenosine(37)-N6)-threonylcarbamoyltransferase complex dimerization subunit type 1 TsaB [Pseudomonadota bacterium]MBU1905342.1 tRNA (adenosine(37)-N6)-threonylcarbamoyltransferase complex dimerization subunit type 1 Ts
MLLAINTSTLQFAIAFLAEDGTILTEHLMSEGKGHFGNLMPALNFMLNSSKSEIRDVKCISIAIGPGSFTGLRVGLSLAKGLCHALRVPVIGISSLEAMAGQMPYAGLPLAPILTSRKEEVFTALFSWNDDRRLTREGEDIWVRFEDFPSLFRRPTLFVGNDYGSQAPLLKKLLGSRALLAPADHWNLKASSIGSLALERFLLNDIDDPYLLSPIYLRPPDIAPNPFSLLSKSNSPS